MTDPCLIVLIFASLLTYAVFATWRWRVAVAMIKELREKD